MFNEAPEVVERLHRAFPARPDWEAVENAGRGAHCGQQEWRLPASLRAADAGPAA